MEMKIENENHDEKNHFVIVRMAVTLYQKMWRKGSPLYQLIWKVEEATNVPQKIKNEITICSRNPISWCVFKEIAVGVLDVSYIPLTFLLYSQQPQHWSNPYEH